MAKSKIYTNFTVKRYTDFKLLQLANNVSSSLTDNPYFSELRAEAALIRTSATEFAAALLEMKVKSHQTTMVKNVVRFKLEDHLRTAALKVISLSKNDNLLLISSGYELTRKNAPVGILPQVQILNVSSGHGSGILKVTWKRVPQARLYEVRYAEINENENPVYQHLLSSQCKIFIRNLNLGKRYSISIAAVGSSPQLQWSLPVTTPYVS